MLCKRGQAGRSSVAGRRPHARQSFRDDSCISDRHNVRSPPHSAIPTPIAPNDRKRPFVATRIRKWRSQKQPFIQGDVSHPLTFKGVNGTCWGRWKGTVEGGAIEVATVSSNSSRQERNSAASDPIAENRIASTAPRRQAVQTALKRQTGHAQSVSDLSLPTCFSARFRR